MEIEILLKAIVIFFGELFGTIAEVSIIIFKQLLDVIFAIPQIIITMFKNPILFFFLFAFIGYMYFLNCLDDIGKK
jgi:hypothetical protein